MEQSLFTALASFGLPGILLFALGSWVVILHRELRDERHARLGDMREGLETITKLQLAANATGTSFAEALRELKELRDRERDRGDRGGNGRAR